MNTIQNNTVNSVAQALANSGYRLCDLDNLPILGTDPVQYIPTSGIVTWKSANKRYHLRHAEYGVTHHPGSGISFGQPVKYDSKTGAIKWRSIIIEGELILDLSKRDQRLQHFLLWHNRYNVKGPCYHGVSNHGHGIDIMVDNPEEKAEAALKKRQMVKSIERLIEDMPESAQIEFAANMGIDVRRNSKSVVLNMLYEKIANDPNEVNKRYQDQHRKVWETVNLAIQYDVLVLSSNGYYYGQTLIGADKKMCVSYFVSEDGMRLLSTIKSAVDQKRGVPVAGATAPPNTGTASVEPKGSGGDTTEFF